MGALHYSVFMKRELSKKTKLLTFKTVFVCLLTYGYEFWVMTERVRFQEQEFEMRFLRRIEGVTLFDKVLSSETRKAECFRKDFPNKANGKRPVGRPRIRLTNCIEDLGWNRLGLSPKRNDGCDGRP